MKEEIKEILEALKPHDKEFASIKEYPLVLNVKEQKILLDYITNLQEENTIKDTNWESLKYYLEKLYYRNYIEETIFDDIDKKIKELESKVEIKGYQKEIKHLQERNNNLEEDFKRHIDRINELTERSDNLQEEIERLNNIIDELEKDLEKIFEKMKEKLVEIDGRGYYYTDLIPIEDTLDKLKKLKEGK